jgi:hypothetical protein
MQMSEHLEISHEACRHIPEGTVLLALCEQNFVRTFHGTIGKVYPYEDANKSVTFCSHLLGIKVSK